MLIGSGMDVVVGDGVIVRVGVGVNDFVAVAVAVVVACGMDVLMGAIICVDVAQADRKRLIFIRTNKVFFIKELLTG